MSVDSVATESDAATLAEVSSTVSASAAHRPLVSLVLPAYNEAAIIADNLVVLSEYMRSLESRFRWEMVIINDGSSDATAELAEDFARTRDNVRVYHHIKNFGLGQAFKFAFAKCQGDYVITLDIDLSYSPDHIERLLDTITETRAKVVLASPYMEGGKISNVPRLRRFMSVWANRFLSMFSHGNLSTLTCMVRAHDGRFIRALNLRATGMEVMPETVYKSMILRARIEQIPAHLDWGPQNAAGAGRSSSMRMFKHILSTLLSGFLFRPFMFFIIPGLVLLSFALYVNFWMVIHFFDAYATLPLELPTDRVSSAVAAAYGQYPHTFIVGLLALMLAVQLISLGILALQSKTYFEEVFHLGSAVKALTASQQRAAAQASDSEAKHSPEIPV